jgi:hypothetical protein
MPLVEQYPNWVSLQPTLNCKELSTAFYSSKSIWRKRPDQSFFAQCAWYKFPYCCNVPWYVDLNRSDIIGEEQANLFKIAKPIFDHVRSQLGEEYVLWGAELNSVPSGVVVQPHSDKHFYSDYTTRVHVVLATNPGVEFIFENGTHHFNEGECFIFNNKLKHSIKNTGVSSRLHLVMDFVPLTVFKYVERSIAPFGGHEGTKHILSFLNANNNEYSNYIRSVGGEIYPFRTVEELAK